MTDFALRKERGEKITMLTAYDATMAQIVDRAGVDAILVGDSLGMVVMGEATTVPVTMDAMVHHTRAVRRGTARALVIADLPFGSYHARVEDAVRNACRLMQEGGAGAVKLEGGREMAPAVERITHAGVPVLGHIGLLPQSVHRLGGYRQVGRTPDEARRLMEDARALQEAGVFALVLECVPSEVARDISEAVDVATIGIGAGPDCDGQVLVSYDIFGLTQGPVPGFVKQYARLGEQMEAAARSYIEEVRDELFPEKG